MPVWRLQHVNDRKRNVSGFIQSSWWGTNRHDYLHEPLSAELYLSPLAQGAQIQFRRKDSSRKWDWIWKREIISFFVDFGIVRALHWLTLPIHPKPALLQMQRAVTAYFTSKQLLLFVFALQHWQGIPAPHSRLSSALCPQWISDCTSPNPLHPLPALVVCRGSGIDSNRELTERDTP